MFKKKEEQKKYYDFTEEQRKYVNMQLQLAIEKYLKDFKWITHSDVLLIISEHLKRGNLIQEIVTEINKAQLK